MTTHVLAGPFVGTGAVAGQGGRLFVLFKPAGNPRNILYEVNQTTWTLNPIGATPPPVGKTYYKDGDGALAFDPDTNQLLVLNFCSPDPATGGKAEPVIWETGIVCPPSGGGTVDNVARAAATQAQTTANNAAAHANQLAAHLRLTP